MRPLAQEIERALAFMAACGITGETTPQIRGDRSVHRARGAAAAL